MYRKVKKITVQGLTMRLRRNALRHKNGYAHYTSYAALAAMLSSERIHLSSRSRLNDLGEMLNDRTFVASFVYGTEENLAMWGLYGVPRSAAVRIKFPCASIREWLDGLRPLREVCAYAYDRKMGEYELLKTRIKRLVFSDVAYSSCRNKRLLHVEDHFVLSDGDVNDERLQGVIKAYPWRYEQEVRLLLEFVSAPVDSRGRKVDTIAIDFRDPIEELRERQVGLMFGPWANGRNREPGQHIVAGHRLRFEVSSLRGLVRYRKVWFILVCCLDEDVSS